ncbi:hypothetical protein LCGC14_1928230 [marine sediment metagenome]|uniref:Uncharacterized protein n=1 Tax=marine sediment metagenome TaxID=412755 RepID=A0A0F9ILK4_9ZZZZ
MTETRQVDAFGAPVSDKMQANIDAGLPEGEDPIQIYRTFQIAREVRNAVTGAKKKLALNHPQEFLDHVEKRLKLRRLSKEGLATAMEKARRLVKK